MPLIQQVIERLWYEQRDGKGYATERELAELTGLADRPLEALLAMLKRHGDIVVGPYGDVSLIATPFTDGDRVAAYGPRRRFQPPLDVEGVPS